MSLRAIDGFIRKPVHRAANYVTGNFAGLSGNLKSHRVLREARSGTAWADGPPNDDAQALMVDGFRILPQRFDGALIAGLRDEFAVKIDNPEHTWSTPNGGYHTAFHKPVASLPNITRLLDKTIIDAVESYYQCYLKVTDVMAWRNRHFSPEETGKAEIYSSRWHLDGSQLNTMTYFVSLRELTEDDGPFHVQVKRRTKQLIRRGFARDDYGIPMDWLDAPEYVSTVTGPAGTNYCAAVGRVLHRAGIPAEGHIRDVVKFGFAPSSTPLADDWAKAFR